MKRLLPSLDGSLLPRVPSGDVAVNVATAELLRDLGEGHVEVPSDEAYLMLSDLRCQAVPELIPYFRPHYFHGIVISMHSKDADLKQMRMYLTTKIVALSTKLFK